MERGHQYEHYGTTEIVEMQKHAELKGSSMGPLWKEQTVQRHFQICPTVKRTHDSLENHRPFGSSQ